MKPKRPPTRPAAKSPGRDPLAAGRCRGLILLILAEEHPNARAEGVVRRDVEEVTGAQDDRTWESNCAYLLDGGYVERHATELRGHEVVSWSATSKGLNLCDGLIDADPGIALDA